MHTLSTTEILLFCSMPFISALIGWLTNWCAVKMIFRPRVPVTLAGVTLVGLIPKRKADLARKIGETVEKELLSHEDIRRVVSSGSFQEDLHRLVRREMDTFFETRLAKLPIVNMLVSTHTLTVFKDMLMEELQSVIPPLMDRLLTSMESSVDFTSIIRRKIEQFELRKFESIVYAIAARELRAIELFGAILGFGIGCIQIIILLAGKMYG